MREGMVRTNIIHSLWIGLVGFTGTKRENPLIRWTWKLHILHPNAGRKSTKSLKRKSKKALKERISL